MITSFGFDRVYCPTQNYILKRLISQKSIEVSLIAPSVELELGAFY